MHYAAKWLRIAFQISFAAFGSYLSKQIIYPLCTSFKFISRLLNMRYIGGFFRV